MASAVPSENEVVSATNEDGDAPPVAHLSTAAFIAKVKETLAEAERVRAACKQSRQDMDHLDQFHAHVREADEFIDLLMDSSLDPEVIYQKLDELLEQREDMFETDREMTDGFSDLFEGIHGVDFPCWIEARYNPLWLQLEDVYERWLNNEFD